MTPAAGYQPWDGAEGSFASAAATSPRVWLRTMEFGVHLPQIEWDSERVSAGRPDRVRDRGRAARVRHDHGERPYRVRAAVARWPDGPGRRAVVGPEGPPDDQRVVARRAGPVRAGEVARRARSAVRRPRRRRPCPGSSQADYDAVGIPFVSAGVDFDEAVAAMRAVWDDGGDPFGGRFYDTTGITLAPPPAQPKGPRVWIGSWGSKAGLRRVARSATAGSPPATTRAPRTSRPPEPRSMSCCSRRDEIRRRSPRPWPRPGRMSPTTRPRSAPSSRGSARCSAGPRRRSRVVCRSGRRPAVSTCSGATRRPAGPRAAGWSGTSPSRWSASRRRSCRRSSRLRADLELVVAGHERSALTVGVLAARGDPLGQLAEVRLAWRRGCEQDEHRDRGAAVVAERVDAAWRDIQCRRPRPSRQAMPSNRATRPSST